MALRKLLGVDHVIGAGNKEVEVASLEGKITLLYFSAHWCPPCRQFTPILAKLYKKLKAEKKEFEIVYISSDRSQEEFDDYFKEHPWLALPYTHRKIKDKLSRKVKVGGVPTLAILDAEARIVSTNARASVMQDQEGKEFPWIPKSAWEILKTAKFINGDKKEITLDDLKKCDNVALYFSAHWCPPCRAFTPRLASVYRKLKAKNTNFEIVFVSLDQSDEEFAEYFSEMPWFALPLGDSRIQELSEALGVESVPQLVTLKSDGSIINKEAKEVADEDPDGSQFPWASSLLGSVCSLNPSQGVVQALNSDVCAVLSINGAPNSATALAEFNKAVEQFQTDFNAKLEADERVRFFIVDDADESHVGLYRKVLSALGAAIPKHGESTVLMMCLPNNRACRFVSGELSADNIVASVKAFKKAQDE